MITVHYTKVREDGTLLFGKTRTFHTAKKAEIFMKAIREAGYTVEDRDEGSRDTKDLPRR